MLSYLNNLSLAKKIYGLATVSLGLLTTLCVLVAREDDGPVAAALVILGAGVVLIGGGSVLVVTAVKNSVKPIIHRLAMLQDHCAADLANGLNAMSEGDLTNTVTPVTPLIDNPGKDELGQIAAAVNGIREKTAPRCSPTTR